MMKIPPSAISFESSRLKKTAVLCLAIMATNGIWSKQKAIIRTYAPVIEDPQSSSSSSSSSDTTVIDVHKPNCTHTLHNPLLEYNSSQYTWTGDHFIPPKGIPTFSPSDFLSYFEQRNTLFIGDSTGRRAYATLFGIINSNDHSDIPVNDIDQPQVIDFNRKRITEICMDPNRLLNETDFVCRNIVSHKPHLDTVSHMNLTSNDVNVVTSSTFDGSNNKSTIIHKGKFDYLWGPCLTNIINTLSMVDKNTSINAAQPLEDYDLIILASGIWEAARKRNCKLVVNTTDDGLKTLNFPDKINVLLNTMKNMSSPNLQIVFRTPGFSKQHKGDTVMIQLTNHVKEYFTNLSSEEGLDHNLTLVDWGTVVEKRSYGLERIGGDITAHYGLEARLLFTQQLLHELLAAEQRGG